MIKGLDLALLKDLFLKAKGSLITRQRPFRPVDF